MISEYQIKVKYNNAISTAEELESIAGNLSKVAGSELEDILTSLGNAWQGENAERFVGKGNRLKRQIAATAREIKTAADTLREEARERYNAEMKALEIAKEII